MRVLHLILTPLVLLAWCGVIDAADNKEDVQRGISDNYDKVIFGKEINQDDYLKFLASLPGGPPAVAAYLGELATSIATQTGGAVAKETVFDLLIGKKENTIVGNKTVYIKIATYEHWTVETYPKINKFRLEKGEIRVAHPNTHQFYVAIGKKQHPNPKLAQQNVSGIPERFRAVNDWANHNGFLSAFPNFHQSEDPKDKVTRFGAYAFRSGAVAWHDIPRKEAEARGLNNTPESRFRAVHAWVDEMHKAGNLREYVSAFPTFHEAEYSGQKVINVYLVTRKYAEYRFVPKADLGNPVGTEALFRAVNDYAGRHKGFVTGYPNMNQGTENNKPGYGCILIREGGAEHKEIRVTDLIKPR